MDENPRASPALDQAAVVLGRHTIQYAHRRRSDRDHPAAGLFRLVDGPGGPRPDLESLFVQDVFFERLGFYRSESSWADVQRDEAKAHFARADFVQHFFGEMKSGRWRDYGTGRPRINRPVTLAVIRRPGRWSARDVRR